MAKRNRNLGSLSPEEGAVRRRALADAQLKAERALPAHQRLRRDGSCAVLAVDGASIDNFKQGIDRIQSKGDRVLWLPAEGNLQGDPPEDFGQATLEAISQLRRNEGFVVVGFEDIDITGNSGKGSKAVIQRIQSLITEGVEEAEDRSNEPVLMEGLLTRLFPERSRVARDIGFLALGTNDSSDLDLPARPQADPSQQSCFEELFPIRLALLESGELTSLYQYLVKDKPSQ